MKVTKVLAQVSVLSFLFMANSAFAAEAGYQITGLVEVEYGYSEDFTDGVTNSSDIVLATVELGVAAAVNDNVDLEVVLLYEEDDTPLEVDTGVINLHDENSPGSLSVGQMYVPFGVYETNMVSDPLTLELGEIRESAVLLNYERAGMSAAFYVFNPDLHEPNDEDKVTQFGFSFGFEKAGLAAGIDYISAINDTDAIQGHLVDTQSLTFIEQTVAGLSVNAMYSTDDLSVVFEYVGALDNFAVTEIGFNGAGAEPSAMNLEVAMPVGNATLAVAYQATDEAVGLGLPEARTMIAYSTEIYSSTGLGFEYANDSDYDVADGGSGNSGYTFTVQLATEF